MCGPQVAARLQEARAELAAAVAEQGRMTRALQGAEQQKRMLKF